VQGCYTVVINGERIPVKVGEEYLIPRGVRHSGEVLAGDQNNSCIWRPSSRAGPWPQLIRLCGGFKALDADLWGGRVQSFHGRHMCT
jgi:hypothetical protein